MDAPGTLKERDQAAVILTAKALRWLYDNPDETIDGFRAWLLSRKYDDRNEAWREVLGYVSERIAPYIWQEFEALR